MLMNTSRPSPSSPQYYKFGSSLSGFQLELINPTTVSSRLKKSKQMRARIGSRVYATRFYGGTLRLDLPSSAFHTRTYQINCVCTHIHILPREDRDTGEITTFARCSYLKYAVSTGGSETYAPVYSSNIGNVDMLRDGDWIIFDNAVTYPDNTPAWFIEDQGSMYGQFLYCDMYLK